jgi:hypothetical protein
MRRPASKLGVSIEAVPLYFSFPLPIRRVAWKGREGRNDSLED